MEMVDSAYCLKLRNMKKHTLTTSMLFRMGVGGVDTGLTRVRVSTETSSVDVPETPDTSSGTTAPIEAPPTSRGRASRVLPSRNLCAEYEVEWSPLEDSNCGGAMVSFRETDFFVLRLGGSSMTMVGGIALGLKFGWSEGDTFT